MSEVSNVIPHVDAMTLAALGMTQLVSVPLCVLEDHADATQSQMLRQVFNAECCPPTYSRGRESPRETVGIVH